MTSRKTGPTLEDMQYINQKLQVFKDLNEICSSESESEDSENIDYQDQLKSNSTAKSKHSSNCSDIGFSILAIKKSKKDEDDESAGAGTKEGNAGISTLTKTKAVQSENKHCTESRNKEDSKGLVDDSGYKYLDTYSHCVKLFCQGNPWLSSWSEKNSSINTRSTSTSVVNVDLKGKKIAKDQPEIPYSCASFASNTVSGVKEKSQSNLFKVEKKNAFSVYQSHPLSLENYQDTKINNPLNMIKIAETAFQNSQVNPMLKTCIYDDCDSTLKNISQEKCLIVEKNFADLSKASKVQHSSKCSADEANTKAIMFDPDHTVPTLNHLSQSASYDELNIVHPKPRYAWEFNNKEYFGSNSSLSLTNFISKDCNTSESSSSYSSIFSSQASSLDTLNDNEEIEETLKQTKVEIKGHSKHMLISGNEIVSDNSIFNDFDFNRNNQKDNLVDNCHSSDLEFCIGCYKEDDNGVKKRPFSSTKNISSKLGFFNDTYHGLDQSQLAHMIKRPKVSKIIEKSPVMSEIDPTDSPFRFINSKILL